MSIRDWSSDVCSADLFGDGHFVGMETMLGGMVKRAMDTYPIGVASREEGGPGGGADGLRRMEISKLYPFCGHLVEVGGLDIRRTEYTDILVTLVVGKDDDNVGLLLRRHDLCTGENRIQASGG